MITLIEGRELKSKKCVKGWAGWTPASEAEKAKFQELVLCPRSDCNDAALRDAEERDSSFYVLGWWALLRRLERPPPRQGPRTNSRKMASDAAKCQNPVRKKQLRKIARKARREFEAARPVLHSVKVIDRPVVTKLWVNGRASEDRDEFRAHCQRCYDDKAETPDVQAERIRLQRVSGDRRVAYRGVGPRSQWIRF